MTIDPTLITALATLLTALAALIKVLQHDGLLRETQATVATVQHQTNSQLESLQAKVDVLHQTNSQLESLQRLHLVALQHVNLGLQDTQATNAELAARDKPPA